MKSVGVSVRRKGHRASFSLFLASLLLTMTTVTVLIANSASAVSGSQVAVTSQDTSGNTISGYYTVLMDSSGNVLATGYTPATFATTSGSSYQVQVDDYGNCTFINWSDGVTSDPRPFTASSGALSFTAVYYCGGTSAPGTSVLTIDAQLNGGGAIDGLYTILYQGGNVVATGYSPARFVLTNGQPYEVEVDGYGSNYFQYWSDTGSVNSVRAVTTSTSLSLTAVICGGPPGTCPDPKPVGGITVYVHRISASYWAPCFAFACSAGTGPGASMYVVLYDSSGNVVQTGFANEQGITFTGLNPGETYYVYPDDCDLCHGSVHDVVFSYWGADVSTTRPLAATTGTSLDAWYSCTNGCA